MSKKRKKVFEVRECTCVKCGNLNWIDHAKSTVMWKWRELLCWKCGEWLRWNGKVKYVDPKLIRFMDINEEHILLLKSK